MKEIFCISLHEIASGGIHIVTSWPAAVVCELLDDDRIRDAGGTLELDCRLTTSGNNITLEGRYATTLVLECIRCLSDFMWPAGERFRYVFLPASENKSGTDIELAGEDLEISHYSGDVLDLKPVVREQLLLNLPPYPLCRGDCRGLCASCGGNLNSGECSCPADQPSDEGPFSVLKSLKRES